MEARTRILRWGLLAGVLAAFLGSGLMDLLPGMHEEIQVDIPPLTPEELAEIDAQVERDLTEARDRVDVDTGDGVQLRFEPAPRVDALSFPTREEVDSVAETLTMLVPTRLAHGLGALTTGLLALAVLALAGLKRARWWWAAGIGFTLATGWAFLGLSQDVDQQAPVTFAAYGQMIFGGLAFLVLAAALILRREDGHPWVGIPAAILVSSSLVTAVLAITPWFVELDIMGFSVWLGRAALVAMGVFFGCAWVRLGRAAA